MQQTSPYLESKDHDLFVDQNSPERKVRLTRRQWIIIGVVVGLTIVGIAVGLAVGLTRNSSSDSIITVTNTPIVSPTTQTYKCVPTTDESHECVPDATEGNCPNNNCCRFNCVGNTCRPGCTGTYSSAASCIQDSACANKSVQYYECTGNDCDPTDSVTEFKNDPCCGDCADPCDTSTTHLQVLQSGFFTSRDPNTQENFGSLLASNTTGVNGLLYYLAYQNSTTLSLIVTQYNPDTQEMVESAINPLATITTPFDPSLIQIGLGSSVALSDNSTDGLTAAYSSADNWSANLLNDTVKSIGAFALNEAITTNSSAEWLFYKELSTFSNQGVNIANQDTLNGPGVGTIQVPDAVGRALTPSPDKPNNEAVQIFFFGQGSVNTVSYNTVDVNVDAKFPGWLSVENTAFLQSIPSNVSKFGQRLDCSDDATTLFIAGERHLVLYLLSNPTADYPDWSWQLIAVAETTSNVSNVAVSDDGLVLAYTLTGSSNIYISARLDGIAGFHHTRIVGVQGIPGVGGLFVQNVNQANKVYTVYSSSTSDRVEWITVQIIS